MGHKTMQRLIPLAALLVLAGCGQGTGDAGADGDGSAADSSQSAEPTVPSGEVVYRGALTVLQGVERDAAELCGAVAESYPPQCGGLPVSGWSWDAVEHDEASGVRWGTYLVTGVFDGKAFVLTEDPVPTSEIDMADYPELQYEEPEIGDPAEDLSIEALQAIADEITAEFPRYVYGGWADEQNGVAFIDTLLVTPELEAYAAEHYPADTVVFASMLKPVE